MSSDAIHGPGGPGNQPPIDRPGRRTDRAAAGGPNSFAEVFEKAKSRASGAPMEPASSSAAPPPAAGPASLSPSRLPGEAEACARTEALLDLLSRLEVELADPAVTLRAMEAAVDRIAAEMHGLELLKEALPDDAALRPIVEEALVVGTVQVHKFRRGDYL